VRYPGILAILLVFFSAAIARADEAADQFAVAAGHYDAKRWKMAADEFQTFQEKFPKHSQFNQSLFFQAEALLQLGQYESAHVKLEDYLKRELLGAFSRPAMFCVGEASYLAGKNDPAEKELGAFAKKYPDDRLNAFALPYLGDIASTKNEFPLAESYYREALKRFPEGGLQDDSRFGLARALEKQNRNDEAEKLYRTVAGKPSSRLADIAQFHLGALQYADGKYSEALETFQTLETKWPKSVWRPNAKLGLGWALVKLNRLDEASKIFQSLASDQKLGVEARYWQGLVRKAKQEWSEAAKILLETADRSPGHPLLPAIRFHTGDALLQAGDTDAAVKQFELLLNEKSSVSNDWLEQAARGKVQAALLTKNYAAVEREAESFKKRFPKSPFAVDVGRMLARSMLEQKQYDRAAGVLEALLMSKPTAEQEWEIRYLLATAQEGSRQFDRALQTIEPAAKNAIGHLKDDAQLLHGTILLALKKYSEAIAPLEAYLKNNPAGEGVVQAMGQLAICHARAGQLDKSKNIYADLRQNFPSHPLLAPITQQLADAAYDADDAAWSADLSSSLVELGVKPEEIAANARARFAKNPSPAAAEYEIKGLAGLGWSQYKAGQLSEAAATFEQVLQKHPSADLDAEIGFVRGQILEKLERYDAAIVLYDRVVEQYPASAQHADAMYSAARLRTKLKQFHEAAAIYQRIPNEHPQYAKLDSALYDWAWTMQDLGKPDEADKIFLRLRNDFPKSRCRFDAIYRLAEHAWEAKNAVQANAFLDELFAGDPEPQVREFGLFLRGQIAIPAKDWNKTRVAFERLLEEFPNTKQRMLAEFWIAESFYRTKEYDEAGKRFDAISQRIPGRQEPWMAMIALRRSQIALTRKDWDRAYELASGIAKDFPDFEQQYEADFVLGRCLANHAEFEEARGAYQRAIRSPSGEKTETAAMAQWMIGETYFHQKNYELALREYLRVEILYAYPAWQALSLLEAAKCHEMLGDFRQAGECYRRIVERYADTPTAKEAKKRMETIQQR
jgi:TolA-binding protein